METKIAPKQATIEGFMTNVDYWIKEFDKTVSDLKDLPKTVDENEENINHNYELMLEMKEELDALKEELKTLRLVQTVMLKDKLVK